MTDKMIDYTSAQKTVSTQTKVLETIDKDGIVCTWNGTVNHDIHKGLDIDFKETVEMVDKEIQYQASSVYVTLEYHLTAHYAQKIENIPYDEMFAASDRNDTILVIEGKKVHVNKAFLSYHSEFFTALFSSNFKEGQLTEIPIKDVTYEDFGLLMSAVYPNSVFPNDKTVEKLLELSDRFLMAFVIHIVEYHLLNNSRISNEKMIWMADKYGMKKLLDKKILSIDTVEKARKLKASPEYGKLSKDAKSSCFGSYYAIYLRYQTTLKKNTNC